jgi:hypothetical protein
MNYDSDNNDNFSSAEEIGSDELLAADNLRLPADANILVRLHAMRAWLNRRHDESGLAVGSAALHLQDVARATEQLTRSRRRGSEREALIQKAQRNLVAAQRRQNAYTEAHELLEDCVAHTTISDRLLVEYYLVLEEQLQAPDSPTDTPWIEAMQDVMYRVEQLGTPDEGEE